jgi:fatty-acid desaturase
MGSLNGTWAVNSVAHLYGTRPYDGSILPVQSMFVAIIASGEGWHNFHVSLRVQFEGNFLITLSVFHD